MKTINSQDLKSRLEAGEVLLIDVREPDEYQASSIPGSHLIPLSEICCDKLPSTEKPIVIHCRSGKRSEMACQKILAENPDLDIHNLNGGILAWGNAGFDVSNNNSCNFSKG